MDIRLGDTVVMKKAHPCGGRDFLVKRVGMDIKIVCKKCGREIMMPRAKTEKGIKKIIHAEENE